MTAKDACVVTNDQTACARLCAKWLYEKMGGEGNVPFNPIVGADNNGFVRQLIEPGEKVWPARPSPSRQPLAPSAQPLR